MRKSGLFAFVGACIYTDSCGAFASNSISTGLNHGTQFIRLTDASGLARWMPSMPPKCERLKDTIRRCNAAHEDPLKEPHQSLVTRKWSDFVYGTRYVNSRYLELFWDYNFRMPFRWIAPVLLLLLGSHVISPYNDPVLFAVYTMCLTGIFSISYAIGSALQLPFDAMRWLMVSIPTSIISVLDYLPSSIALPLVRLLLFVQKEAQTLGQTLIFTGIAVVLWRPMIEEIQYRYILNHAIGKGRRNSAAAILNGGESTVATELPVSFIPLSSINDMESQLADTKTERREQNLAVPRSRTIFLSSIIFASTRLGWFCAHPDITNIPIPFLQCATSPYSWTVGFMQSVMAHFSSRVLSELAPLLQRGLMVLALQQTLSTFFITWHVFAPLYQERGLAASIGAHVAWTIGKMTWPIQLLWRAFPEMKHSMTRSLKVFLSRKRN